MKKVIGPNEKTSRLFSSEFWTELFRKLFFKQIQFDWPKTEFFQHGAISTNEGCFLLHIQLNKQFGIILVIVSKVIQFEKNTKRYRD